MTQASKVIVTKKIVLSAKGIKSVTDKLDKVSSADLALTKLAKKTGEKEFFDQGKTVDRLKASTKELSTVIRTLIESDIKDADVKEYLNTPFSIEVGDRPHFWTW